MEEEILMNAEYAEDAKWVSENLLDLSSKFEGMAIAVRDKDVVEADESLVSLIQKLQERGEDSSEMFIECIPAKGQAFIL